MATRSGPLAFTRIVRNPRILGGEPTVKGTRIPVRSIVIEQRVSGDLGCVREAFPSLDPAAIEEALAFYQANREEIDRFIRENEADDKDA